MLRPYLKIWEWEWIFGRSVKAISSLGVRSPWYNATKLRLGHWLSFCLMVIEEIEEKVEHVIL